MWMPSAAWAAIPSPTPRVLAADGATLQTLPTGAAFPPNLPALYEGLAAQFTLVTKASVKNTEGAPAPLADADGIRKYLPRSYRTAFNFTTPRTEFAKTDDSYHCAIKRLVGEERRLQAVEGRDHLGPRGGVLPPAAAAGRADRAAAPAAGDAPVATTTSRRAAGSPAGLTSALADFDIVDADTELRSYAARIPPIDAPRQLFAAVPVPGRRRARRSPPATSTR